MPRGRRCLALALYPIAWHIAYLNPFVRAELTTGSKQMLCEKNLAAPYTETEKIGSAEGQPGRMVFSCPETLKNLVKPYENQLQTAEGL